MKSLKVFIRLILFSFIVACKFEGDSDNSTGFDEQFAFESGEKSSYLIDIQNDTVLKTENGTQLIIGANTFSSEVDDEVILEITEYYSIVDMILGGLNTCSGKRILETGGMFYMEAFVDSQNVSIESGKSIKILPKSQKKGMELFYGQQTEDGIDWMQDTSSSWQTIIYTEDDTIGEVVEVFSPETQYLNVTKLGWINSDRFLNFKNQTDLIVDLTEGDRGITYSLVFYNYNSLIGGAEKDRKLMFEQIPSNEKVTLVGLSKKGNQLYFNMLDLNTNENGTKFPELELITEEKLYEVLIDKFGNSLEDRPKPNFTYEW